MEVFIVHDLISAAKDAAEFSVRSAFCDSVTALEADFGSYAAFEAKFMVMDTLSSTSPEDPLDVWRKDKTPVIAESAEFLYDLYSGVYDSCIAVHNIYECRDPSALKWHQVKGFNVYKTIMGMYRSARTAVSSFAAE